MAKFKNQAQLSYKGEVTNSNIAVGEILEELSMTKTAIMDDYVRGDDVTYVISITNTGEAAYTGLTVTDNLGEYEFGAGVLHPLTYVEGSVHYYVNGALQTAPNTTAGTSLVFSGIRVPEGGNAQLIYEVEVNEYAPLDVEDYVDNRAFIEGTGVLTELFAEERIHTQREPALTITKFITPVPVAENGELTYTFIIQNSGNTAAVLEDNAIVRDVFDPPLATIAVTLNGETLVENTGYTYNPETGVFETEEGVITVPKAEYAQDSVEGHWVVSPGVSTLVVTGTL